MTLASGVARNNLIYSPLHLRDVWFSAVAEEIFLWSFVEYKMLESTTSSVHEELVSLTQYPIETFVASNSVYERYTVPFQSLLLTWETVTAEFETIEWTDFSSARYEIFNLFRHHFVDPNLQFSWSFTELVKMYHIAFDEYILYHINIYNVWVEEYSQNHPGLESLMAFVKKNVDPTSLSIFQNFDIYTNGSPHLWISYTPPSSWIESAWIFRHLFDFYRSTQSTVNRESLFSMMHKIKKDCLQGVAPLFHPYSHGYSRCSSLSKNDMLTIPCDLVHPLYGVNDPCFELDHHFQIDFSHIEILVCSECGLLRHESCFDESDLESLYDSYSIALENPAEV